MGKFLRQPILMPISNDGEEFVLLSPFEYYFVNGDLPKEEPAVPYVLYKGQKAIQLPLYMTTDMTSAPWIARVFGIDKFGPHGNAALLHDWLYMTEMFPRAVCDRIFLEAMVVLGVSRFDRNAAYMGVRVGGGAVWAEHVRADVEWWRAYGRMFAEALNAGMPPPVSYMIPPLAAA